MCIYLIVNVLYRLKFAIEIICVPVRMVAPIAKNMADIYVNKMPMVCRWRTYTFLLFFHSWGHLRNRPIDCRIIGKIGQFLRHENRHGLAGIQGPRPKWELGHFCWQHKTHGKANIKWPLNTAFPCLGPSETGVKRFFVFLSTFPLFLFTRTQSQIQ